MLEFSSPDNFDRIVEKRRVIDKMGWELAVFDMSLSSVLESRPSPNFFETLCNTIDIAFDYGVEQTTFLKIMEDPKNSKSMDKAVLESINGLTLSKTKPFERVISEIRESNPDIAVNELIADFETVLEIYSSATTFSPKPVRDATEAAITKWASESRALKPSKCEILAYVWRAIELTSSHTIRAVQILTVLAMFQPGRGQLAQVNTGEGKTCIIAMLAVLFCFDDHCVDVGESGRFIKTFKLTLHYLYSQSPHRLN